MMNFYDKFGLLISILSILFAVLGFILAFNQKKHWGWFLGGSALCIYILLLTNKVATLAPQHIG